MKLHSNGAHQINIVLKFANSFAFPLNCNKFVIPSISNVITTVPSPLLLRIYVHLNCSKSIKAIVRNGCEKFQSIDVSLLKVICGYFFAKLHGL